jgi:hypothetical protein
MTKDSTNITGSTINGNFVQGNTQGSISTVINSPADKLTPQQKTIKEIADEIKRLLDQLELANPVATESEQLMYVNISTKPDLKQRVVAALKEGGDTAIDEFVLENKY